MANKPMIYRPYHLDRYRLRLERIFIFWDTKLPIEYKDGEFNILRYYRVIKSDDAIVKLINIQNGDLMNDLVLAFLWATSPEGFQYWDKCISFGKDDFHHTKMIQIYKMGLYD